MCEILNVIKEGSILISLKWLNNCKNIIGDLVNLCGEYPKLSLKCSKLSLRYFEYFGFSNKISTILSKLILQTLCYF